MSAGHYDGIQRVVMLRHGPGFLAFVVVVALLLHTLDGHAATWYVEQNGSGQFTALQPAVDAAASGDTILIGPGWYQELNWVDHFGSPIQVAAYWTDDRDLTFVGTSASEVKIGPADYSQHNDGPQGIYQETSFGNRLSVVEVGFENLYIGAHGDNVDVSHCSFASCEIGVAADDAEQAVVANSRFEAIGLGACTFFRCTSAEVSESTLGAYVYFGGTEMGVVRDCVATGKSLVAYSESNGLVENNTASCTTDEVIAAASGSNVVVRSNRLNGGIVGVHAIAPGTHVLLENNEIFDADLAVLQLVGGAIVEGSGNDFRKEFGSDSYLVRCMSYWDPGSPVSVNLEGNFWTENGTAAFNTSEEISAHILDYNDDPNLKVLIDFEPFSTVPVPAEKKSLGSVKSMFR